jgi:hypothetical protein
MTTGLAHRRSSLTDNVRASEKDGDEALHGHRSHASSPIIHEHWWILASITYHRMDLRLWGIASDR